MTFWKFLNYMQELAGKTKKVTDIAPYDTENRTAKLFFDSKNENKLIKRVKEDGSFVYAEDHANYSNCTMRVYEIGYGEPGYYIKVQVPNEKGTDSVFFIYDGGWRTKSETNEFTCQF